MQREKLISLLFVHNVNSHLRVLEQSVFLDAFDEHELVVAVPRPVQQILHQVLMILKNPL